MFIVFFLLWIIFNGRITLEIVIFGLIIAAFMYAFICKLMDWSLKKDKKWFMRSFLFLQYIYVLLKEIIKANLLTIHMAFTQKYEREPVLVTFTTDLESRFLRVILANSITLTPGSITVSLKENEYVVHCLDKDFSEDLENSVFVKLLERIERVGE